MNLTDRKIETLFYSSIDKLKQIPELRKIDKYDFTEFNELIAECNKIDKISNELKKAIDIDILFDKRNPNDISKRILEYAQSNYDIYITYDVKSYRTQSYFQQQLTTYRKVFEIILLQLISMTTNMSKNYVTYIYNIIEYIKFLDYQTLGYKKHLCTEHRNLKQKNLLHSNQNR